MKIISICNQKGGVGKTTTAMHLAAALVQQDFNVLCIDCDPQGNLSEYLSHEQGSSLTITDLLTAAAQGTKINPAEAIQKSNEGIYYIPSDIRLASIEMLLAQVIFREQILHRVLSVSALQSFDYIFIDCLPSLGILLTNALIASNSIIIPLQTQKFALSGLEDLMNVIELVKGQANPSLIIEGVLLTMTDNTVAARTVESNLRERFGKLVYKTSISKLVEAVDSTFERHSLINTPGSRIGAQYTDVANELSHTRRYISTAVVITRLLTALVLTVPLQYRYSHIFDHIRL